MIISNETVYISIFAFSPCGMIDTQRTNACGSPPRLISPPTLTTFPLMGMIACCRNHIPTPSGFCASCSEYDFLMTLTDLPVIRAAQYHIFFVAVCAVVVAAVFPGPPAVVLAEPVVLEGSGSQQSAPLGILDRNRLWNLAQLFDPQRSPALQPCLSCPASQSSQPCGQTRTHNTMGCLMCKYCPWLRTHMHTRWQQRARTHECIHTCITQAALVVLAILGVVNNAKTEKVGNIMAGNHPPQPHRPAMCLSYPALPCPDRSKTLITTVLRRPFINSGF